MVRLVFQF